MEQEFRFEKGAKDMAGGVETGAGLPTLRFQGMTESIARCVQTLFTNLARIYRFPVGSGPGPEARRKETRLLIVATSSGRLFLNGLLASIARLRFTGTRNLTCIFHKPRHKGTFLLCSKGTFLLCLDTALSAT